MLRLLLSLLVLAYTITAHAQTPAGPTKTGVTVEASGIGGGKNVRSFWQSSWGAYETNFESFFNIVIHVRTWGKQDATKPKPEATIETIWFGRTLDSTKTRVVLAKHKQKIALTPGAPSDTYFDSSRVITGSVIKLSGLGDRYKEGAKIEGWYTRVIWRGRDSAGRRRRGELSGRSGAKPAEICAGARRVG